MLHDKTLTLFFLIFDFDLLSKLWFLCAWVTVKHVQLSSYGVPIVRHSIAGMF